MIGSHATRKYHIALNATIIEFPVLFGTAGGGFFPYTLSTFKAGFVVHGIFTLEAIAITWMLCKPLREPSSTMELET